MKYNVKFSKTSLKQLKKMDNYTKLMLISWIDKNLDGCTEPRFQGKALKGKLSSFWRYRVGNYRIVCEIKDNELIIHVVEIGHRREIYK